MFSINPTTIGSTTYEIQGAVMIRVHFVFDVPISAPFPTFDLKYLATDGFDVKLFRNGEPSLSLRGQTYINFPAFTNRLVSTSFLTEGNKETLTCEIKASAAADPHYAVDLIIRGSPPIPYIVTQLENNPDSPTITGIDFQPPLQIKVSGDVTKTETGWKTHEKGVVILQAVNGTGGHLDDQTGVGQFSPQKYHWKHNDTISIPEFAGGDKKQTISFFAPPVSQTRNILFEAETTFDEQNGAIEADLPADDLFSNKASVSLIIEPLGTNCKIGEEIFINEKDLPNQKTQFLADQSQGIVAVWVSTGDKKQIFISRLDQYDPKFGFKSPAFQITGSDENYAPHAVVLPGGEIAVIYTTKSGNIETLRFKKGVPSELKDAVPQDVVVNLQGFHRSRVVYAGGMLFIFYYQKGWFFRPFNLSQGWLDGEPIKVFDDKHSGFQAVSDEADDALWLASSDDPDFLNSANNANISCRFVKLSLATGQKLLEESRSQQVFGDPQILLNKSRDVWFFWEQRISDAGALACWRVQNDILEAESGLPDQKSFFNVPINLGENHSPRTSVDSQGGIWLFWVSEDLLISNPRKPRIYFSRRQSQGGWLKAQFLGQGDLNEIIITKNDTLWVFGSRVEEEIGLEPKQITKSFYRRIFTKF